MLPPETITPTRFVSRGSLPVSTAAAAAAPEGSTSNFMRKRKNFDRLNDLVVRNRQNVFRSFLQDWKRQRARRLNAQAISNRRRRRNRHAFAFQKRLAGVVGAYPVPPENNESADSALWRRC